MSNNRLQNEKEYAEQKAEENGLTENIALEKADEDELIHGEWWQLMRKLCWNSEVSARLKNSRK